MTALSTLALAWAGPSVDLLAITVRAAGIEARSWALGVPEASFSPLVAAIANEAGLFGLRIEGGKSLLTRTVPCRSLSAHPDNDQDCEALVVATREPTNYSGTQRRASVASLEMTITSADGQMVVTRGRLMLLAVPCPLVAEQRDRSSVVSPDQPIAEVLRRLWADLYPKLAPIDPRDCKE